MGADDPVSVRVPIQALAPSIHGFHMLRNNKPHDLL